MSKYYRANVCDVISLCLKSCCLFTIRIKGFVARDLLTVDLFSIYLLSRVDIVIRYIEVDFTFGLPDYVRYIEVRYIEVLYHTFYYNFGWDIGLSRSLYRGLR